MFRHRNSILIAAALLVAAVIPPLSALASANGQYILSGDSVAVFNLAGKITVEGAGGSDVIVEVTLGGDDSAELSLESGTVDGRPAFRVIYPSDRIVYSEVSRGSRTTVRVRRDGTFGGSPLGSRRITIAGSGPGLEAHADIVVKVPAGKKVAVYLAVGRIDAENIAGDFRLDTSSGPIRVDGLKGALLADTGSGRVTVNDAEGNVEIDTGSGRVNLAGIVGDELKVDTGSGRITGVDIDVRDILMDTGSGDISIEKVRGTDINLDTGSGRVEVDLLSDIRNLIIDTGSGGVTVHLPSELGADIEIDVGSGGISVDVPIEYTRRSRSYVRGQIGDGNGRIYIDTGSGSVRIYHR